MKKIALLISLISLHSFASSVDCMVDKMNRSKNTPLFAGPVGEDKYLVISDTLSISVVAQNLAPKSGQIYSVFGQQDMLYLKNENSGLSTMSDNHVLLRDEKHQFFVVCYFE